MGDEGNQGQTDLLGWVEPPPGGLENFRDRIAARRRRPALVASTLAATLAIVALVPGWLSPAAQTVRPTDFGGSSLARISMEPVDAGALVRGGVRLPSADPAVTVLLVVDDGP